MDAAWAKKRWLPSAPWHRPNTFLPPARLARDVSLGQRIVDIVDKACGGEPERLMAGLMEYRGLTPDEIKRIQSLLEGAKTNKINQKGSRS